MMNIYMVRENGAPIPQYRLPEGFAISSLGTGEGSLWEQVLLDTGFSRQEIGRCFQDVFAPWPEHFHRILMLKELKTGQYIGTTAAWFNHHWQGGGWGQIHWVGVAKAYQGKGLAKPLMSAAMNILVQHHPHSFLETQPVRDKAVRMYLQYGFVPWITRCEEVDAWKQLEQTLGIPIHLGNG